MYSDEFITGYLVALSKFIDDCNSSRRHQNLIELADDFRDTYDAGNEL